MASNQIDPIVAFFADTLDGYFGQMIEIAISATDIPLAIVEMRELVGMIEITHQQLENARKLASGRVSVEVMEMGTLHRD